MAIGAEGFAAAGLVGLGLSSAVLGVILRAQKRTEKLADLLDLAGGENDVPVTAVTEAPGAPPLTKVTVRIAEMLGNSLDKRGALERMLTRAAVPLRPGEFLFLSGLAVAVAGGAAAVFMSSVTASVIVGVVVAVVVAFMCRQYLVRKGVKRRNVLRAQLPDAFSLIASAVASGHTFLRSIQLLREQISDPLSGELDRVVAEVSLGSNLIDALDRMSVRSEIEELRWAVQAVRIQQTTGGQLAEILHTLADFMRAREEVHREVLVLSAEGRFSGWVLMALPFGVAGFLELTTPTYLKPFFQGWGYAWLTLCGVLLLSGYLVIRRLVEIEV